MRRPRNRGEPAGGGGLAIRLGMGGPSYWCDSDNSALLLPLLRSLLRCLSSFIQVFGFSYSRRQPPHLNYRVVVKLGSNIDTSVRTPYFATSSRIAAALPISTNTNSSGFG